MKYHNNTKRVDGLTIAYIGGGSRAWARTLMIGLALEEQLSGTVRLYDVDYDAACDNAAMGNRLTSRAGSKGKWLYEPVRTMKEALSGADFVVLSILPGTFEEMRSDVHVPEKYGVYQSVGDSVGPGGAMRSLRTIPMYVEFAENIKSFCPEAWVINYTNPMTVCTRTLYEIFPGVKAFGCCHEVFDTQLDAADMAAREWGIQGINRSDIKINVLGINHFTWIDRISYGAHDLMSLYREVAEKCAETGFVRAGEEYSQDSVFRGNNKVKFDLLLRYGAIAAAGDRHLAEFMPPWYLKNPETVERWGFALTPVSWRISNRRLVEERRRRIIAGQEELNLSPTGEEGILQIKAILGLGDMVTNANIPNAGQMEGIPEGAIVETNALFSRDSVRPVFAGRLPDAVNSIVLRHICNQEALVKSFTKRDKQMAFNAFANEPLMSCVDAEDAEKMFEEMIENTKAYLPDYMK